MRRVSSPAMSVALVLAAIVACAPASQRPQTTAEPGVTVSGAEMQQHPNESIESMLQRKASGLIVKETPDGIKLTVRNSASFDGTERPPLWVLNGSPYQPGPGGVLSGIDPYEIATIKLLRGAEAALYGIDAANGVIVITTKKGPSKP